MNHEFMQVLKQITHRNRFAITPEALNLCGKYYALLIEENRKYNLTSITGPVEAAEKHFFDSLLLLPDLEGMENPRVLDVGSGAGFPGLPLKICRSDIDLTMLDAVRKKTDFIEMVIRKLALKQARAVHTRAEDHAGIFREQYHVAVSRAVAEMRVLMEFTLPLVKKGGKVIISKGPGVYAELAGAENAIGILGGEVDIVREFALPLSGDRRTVIRIKKIKTTPGKYPRRPGIPRKKPL